MQPINQHPLHTAYHGPALLDMPLLNKGSAFSAAERVELHLQGLLPDAIESIEQQAIRAYQQFSAIQHDLDRHIYLRNLQDSNETLFYRLLQDHLTEMMPIIYTPIVGQACQQFSTLYRRARGLFISYPHRKLLEQRLSNVTQRKIKVIVVTDGERILGLGDLGIGGMGIPIGKLSLYTLCGGINPAYTLPITLDVGTNNPHCLRDPLYLGWRHERICGAEYDDFVDQFIQTVKKYWPNALLQFEDFAQHNALSLLNRYQNSLCCFNDDIQGTAAVTLGCLMAASRAAGSLLSQQRIVFLGAGSAGYGIAELIIAQMQLEGLSEAQARRQLFMVGSKGLLTDQMVDLPDFKRQLAQQAAHLTDWPTAMGNFSLLDVVKNAKPTVLIGVSAQPGLFDQTIVQAMHQHCARPIIMPLSNPTSHIEAHPADLLAWTQGAALVATGSPFAPVMLAGESYPIAQCNNAYIFPGLGLGVLASKAQRITEKMMLAASHALADCSPLARQGTGALLPPLEQIQQVSRTIGFQVAKTAQQQGLAVSISDDELLQEIENNFWHPSYRPYRYQPG